MVDFRKLKILFARDRITFGLAAAVDPSLIRLLRKEFWLRLRSPIFGKLNLLTRVFDMYSCLIAEKIEIT